jgi:hypothetical protein
MQIIFDIAAAAVGITISLCAFALFLHSYLPV